jgi:hypothetical protein
MSTSLSCLQRLLPLMALFTAGALLSAGVAIAQQPNMQNALSQLQAARGRSGPGMRLLHQRLAA